jgi:hypothetical protein
MTLDKFNGLRDKHSQLNNGQFLSFVAKQLLRNVHLTLQQDANLDSLQHSNGTFIPADDRLYPSFLELIQLVSDQKINDVLSLLKKLPSPIGVGVDMRYYTIMEGERIYDKGLYFDRDRDFMDGRIGEGDKPLKRGIENRVRKSDNFKSLLADLMERNSQQIKKIDYAYPPREVVKPKPSMPTPYGDIGDEMPSLTSEQEFEHNEPAEDWDNGSRVKK